MTGLTVNWQDDSSTIAVCFLSLSLLVPDSFLSFPVFSLPLWLLDIFIPSSSTDFSSHHSILLFAFMQMYNMQICHINVVASWPCSSSSFR